MAFRSGLLSESCVYVVAAAIHRLPRLRQPLWGCAELELEAALNRVRVAVKSLRCNVLSKASTRRFFSPGTRLRLSLCSIDDVAAE